MEKKGFKVSQAEGVKKGIDIVNILRKFKSATIKALLSQKSFQIGKLLMKD